MESFLSFATQQKAEYLLSPTRIVRTFLSPYNTTEYRILPSPRQQHQSECSFSPKTQQKAEYILSPTRIVQTFLSSYNTTAGRKSLYRCSVTPSGIFPVSQKHNSK